MDNDNLTEKATFSVPLGPPRSAPDLEGFNEYGVRENLSDDGDLESIDVTFDAMEPGIRKGIEVTPEFLDRIATKYTEEQPAMLDHSDEQLKQVGRVTKAKFDESLRLMVNIPNTGSSTKSDVISDFTHSPPAITDGSVGFDPKTLTFTEAEDDDAIAQFEDGALTEFSFTPFPAGYDDGGLSPVFSDAIDSSLATTSKKGEAAESQLVVNDSKLISN